MTERKLLLISSSTVHGNDYLEHCSPAIESHIAANSTVLFLPYALADHDRYESTVKSAFDKIGREIQSIHHFACPITAIGEATAIFIGGGNSFRLLKTLYDLQLVEPIRTAVAKGTPYMGSSAGTNMACPTICTTNDMPIVQPPSFNALNLIPFQINPHYIDADPHSTHKGETREQRIKEFHEEQAIPVVGVPEISWLEIQGNHATIGGRGSVKLFRQNHPVEAIDPQSDVSYLLQ